MLQVKAGFSGPLPELPDPQALLRSMTRTWADDARARIQEKAGGGPGSRYLISRTGNTRASAFAEVTADGAVVGARGPGVNVQEEGATITAKRGRWLTFRLMKPEDTDEATGRWVRARSVTIRPKHFVRDSVEEAMLHLPEYLDEALQEAGW